MNILALNAGSSSLKFRLGPPEGPARFTGEAQGFGHTPAFDIRDASGAKVTEAAHPTLADAAKAVLDFAGRQAKPDAIGHRFVHGGPGLLSHRRIDVEVRAALIAASQFAPLHNPPALEVLALSDAVFPGLPQVACLDTAFHADMPLLAQRLPLPANRLPPGLRRYGFHGLSCESILEQFDTVPPRLVIAHLGGGASVTAVKNGRSLDSSMGLTPTGGLMMETRSGDLDPGVLIYLLRRGETADSLEQLVNRQSGLAGISGQADLRAVRALNDANGTLALEMFAISAAKAIAAMAAVLDGMDMLVFTGGIGEHDGGMREAIGARLGWMGKFSVQVLPAREEIVIARHTARLAGAGTIPA